MREIEFRGKGTHDNSWYYGYLNYDQKDNLHKITQGKELSYFVDPNTVCQYTGIIARNGVKIFENDILWDEINEEYGVVKYFENAFVIVAGNVIFRGIEDFEARNVIGNVYDDVELLN